MSESTSGDAKVAALRNEIEQTRTELGETVEELAARADVKARAKEKVEETKAKAVAGATEAKDKAVGTARQIAENPAVPARRAVTRVRTSVQEHPKQWVVVAAALLAFAALVIGKRRRDAAQRVTLDSLRAEWRKQWEAAK
jgi:ElaB/YqjD/DUF883 family membrane-anchored ribosome-binding protein